MDYLKRKAEKNHPSEQKEHHHSHDYYSWQKGGPFDHTATIREGHEEVWDMAEKYARESKESHDSLDLMTPQQIYEKTIAHRKENKYGDMDDLHGYEDDFETAREVEGIRAGVDDHRYINMRELKGQTDSTQGKNQVRDQQPIKKKTYVNIGKSKIPEDANGDLQDIYDNFVHGHYITDPMTKEPEMFISAQSPTETGIFKFLSMIHFKKIALLVMICQMSELQPREMNKAPKCSTYFPMKVGQTLKFGFKNELKIKNLREIESNDYYTKRELEISFSKMSHLSNAFVKSHTFTHVHIHDWEDMKFPTLQQIERTYTILRLVKHTKEEYPRIPVVVHCSAGIGRTGTFESMYFLKEQVQEYKKEIREQKMKTELPVFSVTRLVVSLKSMREGSVQTSHQFGFLYRYLVGLFEEAVEEGYKEFMIDKYQFKQD